MKHLHAAEALLVLLPLALAWVALTRLGRWLGPAGAGKSSVSDFSPPAPVAAALPVVISDCPVSSGNRTTASAAPRARPRRPRARKMAA